MCTATVTRYFSWWNVSANWSQSLSEKRWINLHGSSDVLRDPRYWTEVKTSLNHWMLHAIVDENQHFWHSSVLASSPCEQEAYFRESAATARFAMRLSKLSKSSSCVFSSVLKDCNSLRLSILVMQRGKMSMIRFSANVVQTNCIIEAMGSSSSRFSSNWVAKSLQTSRTRSNAFQVQLSLTACPPHTYRASA